MHPAPPSVTPPHPETILAGAHRARSAGAQALRGLPAGRLCAVWDDTVAAFRDAESAERRDLDPRLAESARLSRTGLRAALEVVLHGVAPEIAAVLVNAGGPRLPAIPADARSPLDVVLLASNLPGLVVQPLLRSLAARRPVVLKSPSAEPHFTAAFAAALGEREPALAAAVVPAVWRGGDRAIEDPLFALAGRVIAYGDQATLEDLRARLARADSATELREHGPKTSVALVDLGSDLDSREPLAARRRAADLARQLARDVALFDQRGCLSVAAVWVKPARSASGFATELRDALALMASESHWPPGPATLTEAAGARLRREDAAARGWVVLPLVPLAAGTVIVAGAGAAFQPSPGLRTVTVHGVDDLEEALAALADWRGRLQGAAVTFTSPLDSARWSARLLDLGVTRIARVGELQHADARWDDARRSFPTSAS